MKFQSLRQTNTARIYKEKLRNWKKYFRKKNLEKLSKIKKKIQEIKKKSKIKKKRILEIFLKLFKKKINSTIHPMLEKKLIIIERI